jgi:hypothetical protein
MAYGISARIIHHTIEQDQKIPIRLRMCIAACTGAIQHNVCRGLDLVHRLFDAFQEFRSLHHTSPLACRAPLLRL